MAITFKIINSGQALSDSDKALYDEAENKIKLINQEFRNFVRSTEIANNAEAVAIEAQIAENETRIKEINKEFRDFARTAETRTIIRDEADAVEAQLATYEDTINALNTELRELLRNNMYGNKADEVDAKLAEQENIREHSEYGQLQTYLKIRRRAYEEAYGSGSYPYQHDAEDLRFDTRSVLILDDGKDDDKEITLDDGKGQKKIIGGFRLTFKERGDDRKLRFENKEGLYNAEQLLPYLRDPEWGSKAERRMIGDSLKRRDQASTRSAVKKMRYGELGSYALDPGDPNNPDDHSWQNKGIGRRVRTAFFKFIQTPEGIEQAGMKDIDFFVAEATPRSIRPLLKASVEAGYPAIVHTDAGAVIKTSNGTDVPRFMVVLSPPTNMRKGKSISLFIEEMKNKARHYQTPENWLKMSDRIKEYEQHNTIRQLESFQEPVYVEEYKRAMGYYGSTNREQARAR